MMRSILERRGMVEFPMFSAERVYMEPFTKREGLPWHLSRWNDTVAAMLDGIGVDGPLYLMIDQSFVPAGTPHRRPGVHIDGYWNPAMLAHGPSSSYGGGHGYSPPSHSYRPPTTEQIREIIDIYSPKKQKKDKPKPEVPAPPPEPPTNVHPIQRKIPRKPHFPKVRCDGWGTAMFDKSEAILLASNVEASRAFVGEFGGGIADGGNCDAVSLDGLVPVPLVANRVYAGNVTCLHESLPVLMDCERTLVRINVPGWEPAYF